MLTSLIDAYSMKRVLDEVRRRQAAGIGRQHRPRPAVRRRLRHVGRRLHRSRYDQECRKDEQRPVPGNPQVDFHCGLQVKGNGTGQARIGKSARCFRA